MQAQVWRRVSDDTGRRPLDLTGRGLVVLLAWLSFAPISAGGDPTSLRLSETIRLNDTGITQCTDDSQDGLPCPVVGFPGQDGEFGRDVTHNHDGNGLAGFKFTKLDASGNALPVSAKNWSCVRDDVTKLIWEVKTNNGGLRDQYWTYSWYDPDPDTNGGEAGIRDGGACDGGIDCDTDSFVQAVNARSLCGASDWRLPSRRELLSIINNARYEPAIETRFFKHTPGDDYWSSSPYKYDANYAWSINIDFGFDSYVVKRDSFYVRLVRGRQYDAAASATDGRFNDNGNGTITDGATRLTWKRCAEGLGGPRCDKGTVATYTWKQALNRAVNSNYAGFQDWRLPNKNELESLVELHSYKPAINVRYFPNTDDVYFWSSTSYAISAEGAWSVDFGSGGLNATTKFFHDHVRLVRGGQE